MDLKKKRWIILVACCLINLCLGSIYSWSIFADAMAKHFSDISGTTVTVANLAIVYTIANAVSPVTMISGGWFNDKFGPKIVLLVGGFLFGLGMILSGFTTNVGWLIVTYGLISGFGMGMTYGTCVSTCVKFFPDKRGIIGGITTTIYGLSSVILPFIITPLASATNGPITFQIIGGSFLAIIVISALFVSRCPAGYVPEGWNPPEKSRAGAIQVEDKNWKGMLRSPEFYVMLFLLMCGAFCGMMIIPNAKAIGTNMVGLESMVASTAVSILALFNALGRLGAGTLSDKIGRINTLTIACTLSIVGMIILYFTGLNNIVLFFIGIGLVGICFGSFMGVFPGFTADQFGAKNNSVNYGVMFVGFALAGLFGPIVMTSIVDSTGAYQVAFIIAAILSSLGVVLTFVFRFVIKRKQNKTKIEAPVE